MNKIQVEVVVDATLEKVWDFWNNPEKIRLWAFASNDWECPYAENNLAVGGMFVTRMSAKDKSFSFDFSGTYTEVEEYSKINYVMSPDGGNGEVRKCEIVFSLIDGGGKVRVVETFDPEKQNSEELQRAGWQSILDNFKKAVETAL